MQHWKKIKLIKNIVSQRNPSEYRYATGDEPSENADYVYLKSVVFG